DFLVELPNHPGVPKTYDKLRNSRDSRCIRSKHVGVVCKLFVQRSAEHGNDRISLFIGKFKARFFGENKGLLVHRELRDYIGKILPDLIEFFPGEEISRLPVIL